MEPEDIEGRDFFVGLRGYDRDEVHTFLAEVAAEHRQLRSELEAVRAGAEAAPARDPFEDLGANVTAILRTANESAAGIRAEAESEVAGLREAAEADAVRTREDANSDAATIRFEADEYAERARSEVDEETRRVRAEADQYAEQTRSAADADAARIRSEAEQATEEARTMSAGATAEAARIVAEAREQERSIVEEAHAEANRILAEADGRADEVAAEAERQGRARALAAVEAEVARLDDAARRHQELRARMVEASDELQLALMAMGEPIVDAAATVHEVIDLDATESNHHEPARTDG